MVTKALIALPMRRSLVLTNETARHPFRASLPTHVFEVVEEPSPQHEPEVRAAMNARGETVDQTVDVFEEAAREWWRLTRSDVRGFVSTYLAVFLAVLVFII